MPDEEQAQPEGELLPDDKPETPSTSETAAPEGEAQDGEPTEPEAKADDTEPEPKPKKRSGFQKRISGLTEKNRQLQAQLDGIQAKESQPDVKEPNRDDYSDYEQYLDARADYRAETKFTALKAEADAKQLDRERKSSEREIETQWEDSTDAARDKYDDFDDIAFGDVKITDTMGLAIKDSKGGAEVAYYLGKHTEESERISNLSPLSQIKAIGRIEERLKAQPSKQKVKPAPRGRTSQTTASNALNDKMTTKEWVEQRRKEVVR